MLFWESYTNLPPVDPPIRLTLLNVLFSVTEPLSQLSLVTLSEPGDPSGAIMKLKFVLLKNRRKENWDRHSWCPEDEL